MHWHDAGSGVDCDDAAEHHRQSVGWLVKRNRAGVWISMESDGLSQVHFIPRGMVEKVVDLLKRP